ncbi:MAG: exonuclease SbcCD subunit D, partial [Candidatus Hydrothermarchaeota archaeon]
FEEVIELLLKGSPPREESKREEIHKPKKEESKPKTKKESKKAQKPQPKKKSDLLSWLKG